jgi:hypothetical protein
MKFHYDTVTIAIAELARQGYSIDFNLPENRLTGAGSTFDLSRFKIRDIYRYEGDSDPADEVILYAIESGNGDKGIFVSGYGASLDQETSLFIEGLMKAD